MPRTITALCLAVALALTGCATSSQERSAAPATADAASDEHTEAPADEHAIHDAPTDADPADAPASGDITADTIAKMQALDPARAAAAHRHDHDGDHAKRDHPNGVIPERIVIPAIGVDADVIELGLEPNGEMEVPTDFAQTGWFKPGVPPGRVGPAVIAGHVDSRSGPAVFFELRALEPGDQIEIHDAEGEVVVFEVRITEQHGKDDFPTEKVYAGTPTPELRLITCSGEFDRGERSYTDNLIVYAERIDV